jgi:uncharacterized protein YukE
MVGNAEQIRALARRLQAEAEQVRHVAVRVGGTTDIPWRSPAATAFRQQVVERAQMLRGTARALDDAAASLEAHATGVESAVAELVRVAQKGEQLARGAVASVRAVGR